MGVNFGIVFVLLITITVSYINAQGYVMLDDMDFDVGDNGEQRSIFLDQSEHVIHRREVDESESEASGNGENDEPAILLDQKNITYSLENEPPRSEDDPINKVQEKEEGKQTAALPEESANNKTSLKEAPVDDTQEKSKENAESQISNFEETNPVEKAEEASNYTEAKIETKTDLSVTKPEIKLSEGDEKAALPEESLNNQTSSNPEKNDTQEKNKENVEIQISNFRASNLVENAEETPKSNETKTEPDQHGVDKENVQVVETKTDLPATKPEVKLTEEGEQAAALPEEPLNNQTSNNIENEASPLKVEPSDKTQEQENVEIQISNFRASNLVENAEETPKSNETKTELDQSSVDKAVEIKTDLPVTKSEVKVNEQSPPATAQPETKAVDPVEEVFENVANVTTKPTEKPDIIEEKADIIEEKPVFSPIIHNITSATVPQKEATVPKEATSQPQSVPQSSVTPASKIDSPILPAKEDSASNIEGKDSGKEEESKITPKVLPSDLAEVESINKKKESEYIHEEQSGNAFLVEAPNGDGASPVEGSDGDKVLKGMQENAKISVEPTEQPNAGESAKNVSRASKDTTILVVLFVVVIAIGGAAFTHNYIKKRKQNTSTNNDLVNGIRRSLQNLSSNSPKTNTDVEKGTELKPLMKDGPTITKDYTDTKKEVPA